VSRRALLVILGAAVALGLPLLFLRAPAAGPPPPPRRAAGVAPRRPAEPAPPASAARNVFEFAEPKEAPVASAAPAHPVEPAPPAPSVAAAPAADPVRLVGLVHRGGQLRAALSIGGTVVVLGAGEEAEGYRVLSVEEEAGVRLRGPDGIERSLSKPAMP
jgi:hypothetical protein